MSETQWTPPSATIDRRLFPVHDAEVVFTVRIEAHRGRQGGPYAGLWKLVRTDGEESAWLDDELVASTLMEWGVAEEFATDGP